MLLKPGRTLRQPVFIRSSLSLCILLSIATAHAGAYFDPGLLQAVGGAPEITDLNAALANKVKAGTYHVYISVNGEKFATDDIPFIAKDEALVPCLSAGMYAKIGIDPSSHEVHIDPKSEERSCVPLSEAVPLATADFDFLTKKLSLSFPQTTLRARLKDEIPPELWDDGIPALLVGYQANGSQTLENTSGGSTGSDNFVNVNSGINIGPWRLRNLSTLSQSSDTGTEWSSLSTYVERAIPALKAELTLGDAYTTGDLFDSIRIKGMQLASDTEMLPQSINGFSPVIRGVANSNATVTVRQNNNVIYQTNVAPGPFAINDLAPVSSGGSLDITVKEADGSEKHFTQSFSSIPVLQRQGAFKYALSAGKYSEAEIKSEEPAILQAVAAYGLPYDITLLSGVQNTNDYHSFDLGVGLDLGFMGAVSLDVAKEKSTLAENNQQRSGSAAHLAYTNHIDASGSDINVSATQYSEGYVSLADNYAHVGNNRLKDKQFSLSLNQSIGSSRSLFISVNQTDYQDSASTKMYQFGFNTPIWLLSSSITFSLNQNEDQDGSETRDKQIMANFSLPFSVFDIKSRSNASLMLTNDLQGNANQTLGLSGNVMDSDAFTYSAQLGYEVKKHQDDGKNATLSADYKGGYGEARVGYNQDENQKQITYSLSGLLLVHRHGATLGQYSDGAVALISAPGAKNIGIKNNVGVYTDWRGYTVVPGLSNYANNTVQIDADSLGADVSFDNISTNLIPTKDAVVLADLPATLGRKVLFTIQSNGKDVPFGAEATLNGGDKLFFVGEGGQLFVTGAPDEGEIAISINDSQSCKAPYRLPERKGKSPITMMNIECRKS